MADPIDGSRVSPSNSRVGVLFTFDLKLPLFLTSTRTRSAILDGL
jgi:hypothetical protein